MAKKQPLYPHIPGGHKAETISHETGARLIVVGTGESKRIREKDVADAVREKLNAQEYALTDQHPAVKAYEQIMRILSKEEKAEVERRAPGSLLPPNWWKGMGIEKGGRR